MSPRNLQQRTRGKDKTYPPEWPSMARAIKDAAGWRCVRCGHPHDPPSGYTLTVHHLDMNPPNLAWWNLAALCQRCHLSVQNRVDFEQAYMLEHTGWMRSHVEGYRLWRETGILVVNVKFQTFDTYIGRWSTVLARAHGRDNAFSHWQNPFKVGVDGTRDACLDLYRRMIEARVEEDPEKYDLGSLRGQRVGCWCKPLTCHGDVLAELVARRAA